MFEVAVDLAGSGSCRCPAVSTSIRWHCESLYIQSFFRPGPERDAMSEGLSGVAGNIIWCSFTSGVCQSIWYFGEGAVLEGGFWLIGSINRSFAASPLNATMIGIRRLIARCRYGRGGRHRGRQVEGLFVQEGF